MPEFAILHTTPRHTVPAPPAAPPPCPGATAIADVLCPHVVTARMHPLLVLALTVHIRRATPREDLLCALYELAREAAALAEWIGQPVTHSREVYMTACGLAAAAVDRCIEQELAR